MTQYLGLDLGGTNVKAAIVEQVGGDYGIVTTASSPTNAAGGPEAVAATMVELGRSTIAEGGPVAGVGVGVPGLFDFASGEIVFFTNLPGPWEGFPLRHRIAEGIGVPATLINDAR
ncbi:MAG TPA: ROK family protein, partial [Acidimicrobiia bacterium]|nr:ROK family protein [Acidimicrobiia bacterium]